TSILINSAVDLGSPGDDDSTGYGALNAHDAVSLALGGFPVEWLDFSGRIENGIAQLQWSTGSEQNNAYFEVQKSKGGSFVSVGQLAGQGNSSEVQSYQFEDPLPFSGRNYYRIKQVDSNGSFTYSKVLDLSWEEVSQMKLSSLYPNPSHDLLTVSLALPRGMDASYKVFDLKGRPIINKKLYRQSNIQEFTIQTKDWIPGIYILQIRNSKGETASKRFSVLP
ncbi:MAG: S8/S53 family peptidase, partial [Bacteroidota bacterium]